MNTDISIQKGTPEHLSAIHDLVLEWGYSANESQTGAWLEALLASPNHQVFVAVSNASVVGWAVAERRISLGELFTSEITGLVVSTRARRAGVGRLLVQAVEDWSRTKGLSRVVVRSNVSRSESHGFYPSIGFELTKTAHVYIKDLEGSTL
ncbi:GNAT family N-acetyltransferase [Marinobacter sp. 71-i]|uniref:Probable N-acetyltransferase 14 n=1 Tax=Marinobacter iranensis TaxID=2962607 RepID=A0ABT5YFD7_9GAMM|nr:GNAT family N-acetyltransferase [Marinobacter iranensis]MDF0752406.1 GNAT family N-acetyltransferase [Marinobacter iranensis]